MPQMGMGSEVRNSFQSIYPQINQMPYHLQSNTSYGNWPMMNSSSMFSMDTMMPAFYNSLFSMPTQNYEPEQEQQIEYYFPESSSKKKSRTEDDDDNKKRKRSKKKKDDYEFSQIKTRITIRDNAITEYELVPEEQLLNKKRHGIINIQEASATNDQQIMTQSVSDLNHLNHTRVGEKTRSPPGSDHCPDGSCSYQKAGPKCDFLNYDYAQLGVSKPDGTSLSSYTQKISQCYMDLVGKIKSKGKINGGQRKNYLRAMYTELSEEEQRFMALMVTAYGEAINQSENEMAWVMKTINNRLRKLRSYGHSHINELDVVLHKSQYSVYSPNTEYATWDNAIGLEKSSNFSKAVLKLSGAYAKYMSGTYTHSNASFADRVYHFVTKAVTSKTDWARDNPGKKVNVGKTAHNFYRDIGIKNKFECTYNPKNRKVKQC